jgi:hypothetical protein
MRRLDEPRGHVTSRDERLTPTRDPWVLTEEERRMLRDRPVVTTRPERSTWRLAVAALIFAAAALAFEKGSAGLHAALDSIPWAKVFGYQPVSPIDPGDRNGLLHEH